MRAQGRGSSAQPPHASKKGKHTPDVQSSGKGVSGSPPQPEVRKAVANAPHHGRGKGLMTYQGLIAPLPLLVKDKGYAVDTAHSIIRDADLDKCLEHETDPLGDSSLHDMMRVYVSISLVPLCRPVPLFNLSLSDIDSSLLN